MRELINQCIGEFTFITGANKNVGKTTLLNYLAKCLREYTEIVLTSVGVDGHARDLVFENQKPLVRVEKGDFVLTTELAIRRSQSICRILETFSGSTVLGKMVFVEVLRGDFIELIGPETNNQLAYMLEVIFHKYAKKTVLIDGSANRVTQVGSFSAAKSYGVIDVIKITPLTKQKAFERIKFLAWVKAKSQITVKNFLNSSEHLETCFHVEGGLTEDRLNQIDQSIQCLLMNDYSGIFVSLRSLELRKLKVYFKNVICIRGIVLVFHDVREDIFNEELKELGLENFVFKNPYKGVIL